MKKSLRITFALALLVAGIFFLGYMLHISDRAQSSMDTWLYGSLAVAPILIGTAWFGAAYRKMRGSRWNNQHNLNTESGDLAEELANKKSMRQAAYRWAIIAFGVTLVSVGIMILMYNSGYIPSGWSHVFISWWMLLLLVGLGQLEEGRYVNAAIFMLLGGFFIAPRIAAMFPAVYEPTRAIGFLPVLLIGLGVIVIIAAATRSCCGRKCSRNKNWDWSDTKNFDVVREEVIMGDGRINESLRFSGMDKVILDPVFNGGNIDVRFAGAVLDLRRTSLPEGVTTLFLNGKFSGVNIITPNHWHIEVQNNNSFGGFYDKRSEIINNPDADRKLVIVASFRFGGGEISSTRK